MTLTTEQILGDANACGLSLATVIGADTAQRALKSETEHLARWQAAKHAGEMKFMERPPSLFTELQNFLPGCKSLVVCLVPYYQGAIEEQFGPRPRTSARVARYAWGRDYHTVLRDRMERLASMLMQRTPGLRARAFTDAVPLLERTLAKVGGLGFIGRNAMLLRYGVGSFTFVAELLLDVAVEDALSEHRGMSPDVAVEPGAMCGSCTRCVAKCPTEAIVSSGVIDSRRCISYLTIEKRGELSPWERSAIGEWIFGCDICQEVCPFNNRGAETTTVPEFFAEKGIGPYLDLERVLSIRSDAEFREQFGGTPIMRTKREGLLRNACYVTVNEGLIELVPLLEECALDDRSPVVKNHALWALEAFKKEKGGARQLQSALECIRVGTGAVP